MRLLIRWLRRFALLGLGIVGVWFVVFVLRMTHRRLPTILALSLTYASAAYVMRVVRMGLKILQRKSVPSFTLTGDGLPSDPVNPALIGEFERLRAAFARAGWIEADPLNLRSSWGMAVAFVLNKPYPADPFVPSVAKMPSILLTIDRRSPVKSSRSRYARRASSSASLGIGAIEQTRGSPLSQAINVRSNISTSMISVFARRARRSTGRLDGWITWTSTPRRARKRASQNPSRPASWVRMTRAILRPATAHLAFRRSTKEAKGHRKLPAHVANAG